MPVLTPEDNTSSGERLGPEPPWCEGRARSPAPETVLDALSSPSIGALISEGAPVLDAAFTLLAEIGSTRPNEGIAGADERPAADGADSDAVGDGSMGGLPAFRLGETAGVAPS